MRNVIHDYIFLREKNDPTLFISTWDTTKAGTSASNQITLPLTNSNGRVNCTVDWGDGTKTTLTSWNDSNKTHTFPSPGIYQIKIKGIFFKPWGFKNGGDKRKILSVQQWGTNEFLDVRTAGQGFYGCSNLKLDNVIDVINSPGGLINTFRDCTSLIKVNRINEWDIGMSGTFGVVRSFQNCPNLLLEIKDWDFTTVKDLSFFITGTGKIPTNFYDDLLVNTWNRSSLRSGITADFGNSKYTLGSAAATARANIISTYGWTINDGGGI